MFYLITLIKFCMKILKKIMTKNCKNRRKKFINKIKKEKRIITQWSDKNFNCVLNYSKHLKSKIEI